MKTKLIILVFLIGILIGIGISPWVENKPQDFISPLSQPLAENINQAINPNQGDVLGEKQENKTSLPSPLNASNSAQTLPSMRKPVPQYSKYSQTITIAIIGDSMTDVMETNLPFLKEELRIYFPLASFYLYNYGIGAENIEKGKERISKPYDYKERHYPSLIALNPNIVVIDPFNYNPFGKNTEDELYQHWANLAQIVDLIKNNSRAKILILATIAPNKEKFGQGPKGINWSANDAWNQAVKINQYLNNTIKFAKTSNLPLIDVYHQSLTNTGEGNPEYINPDNYIHQNAFGNQLIAKNIAQAIYSLNIFQ